MTALRPSAPLLRSDFGPGFRFGVATSAYQIEGAVHEDGRGASIWDRFAHTEGKTKNGDHGDVACDHYHRMPEDVDLLAWLGVDSYRFSIAWPRVVPAGRGSVNQKGLDFYDRLVDALLERGISPCATLYHWDLPDALPEGWLSRDTAHAFAEYASLVGARLGDRVALWLTHNEPWCQAFLGYETGLFAPGHKNLSEALRCAHHLLVSHGLAVQALRSHVKTPIGIAPNVMPAHAASTSEADVKAARRFDGYFNRWFIEPLLGRGYPTDMVALYGRAMPKVSAHDRALMAEPVDVLGINYYERIVIADDPHGGTLRTRSIRDTGLPKTADREVYPAGLGEMLRRLHVDYGFQHLVVTENGAAFADRPDAEGKVRDGGRVEFIEAHLREVLAARRAGVPVEGYFAWSLMDNFEWAMGYDVRYGLMHVDYTTLARTPKDSAHFYRSFLTGAR